MTVSITRTDATVFGRWWWTIDRLSLTALGMLIGLGAIMVAAASPPVAERINLPDYHFIQRHLVLLVPTIGILVVCSTLSANWVRRVSLLVLLGGLAATAATLVIGVEIKGATRWLHLPGMTLQPSEFLKPAFAVTAAWLFSLQKTERYVPGYLASALLYALVMGLLLMQPDLGMAVVVTAVWGVQFFVAGLPIAAVILLGLIAIGGGVASYFTFPHVASRIDRFMDPESGDSYQIDRSLDAFANGGVWGVGPGEGAVKQFLPDAHSDFVFAVAGEEFGLLWCLLLVALFGFVVIRSLIRASRSGNLFVVLAVGGLAAQFGFQALINMGSTLSLIPTKGMTLPFISYGGSSMLALALGTGLLLALTRRQAGGRT
ncbi:MAG: putative peptidoglycan glycosyltransferase FtsW [Pseudomonadota bacterium]